MTSRKISRATTVAMVTIVMTLASFIPAFADNEARQGVKNVVLVHGSWADGSSWAKVIPLLRARGLQVIAVQNPLTSFEDDLAAVKRAIAAADGPLLLVGHSYGGTLITEAGNDPKVAGLVYVAAFAPEQNETTLGLATDPKYATPGGTQLVVDTDTGFITLTRTGIRQDFAQDLSDIEKEVLFATQGPWSSDSALGAITSPAWKVKKTWFIIAAHDRMVSADLERDEAARMHAVTFTLSTSHVAMLADPFGVAAIIAQAADRAGR